MSAEKGSAFLLKVGNGGDISLSWVRRSRAGWTWLSGSDTPLAEEAESYRLTVSSGTHGRTVVLSSPHYLYSAAEQAADGSAGAIAVTVVQLGTSAASRPAQTIIP